MLANSVKTKCPPSQWASDVLWTSNGRLYEVGTSCRRRPLDVQRTSDAHWLPS